MISRAAGGLRSEGDCPGSAEDADSSPTDNSVVTFINAAYRISLVICMCISVVVQKL